MPRASVRAVFKGMVRSGDSMWGVVGGVEVWGEDL